MRRNSNVTSYSNYIESNEKKFRGSIKLETNSANIHQDNIIIPKHNKTNPNPY